ncbi:hypothetical protein GCM10023314_20060 [Algibacter agarivorans]|uniref:Uncharacterized protein n=1 Tax=Algibacter agarivorans TaxID=1109741 RepID=A0ABP9GL64_9FLAO
MWSYFINIEYHEGIILKHCMTEQEIFLTHGHQADWWNYLFWKWSRFMVRVLWKPLNVMGIADPTSPAKNYKELIKVERRTKKMDFQKQQFNDYYWTYVPTAFSRT